MDGIIVFILAIALLAGFVTQSFLRCSPQLSLGISFLLVLILPSFWGIGMTVGLWVCCAFLTFHPEEEQRREARGLRLIVLYSFFTFSGFILTLLILWKIKIGDGLISIGLREILAWCYLVIIEICFYKVISFKAPKWNRFQIGYGIGFSNTLMLLFWLLPYGYKTIALTLTTLLVINPLLLFWVDRPGREADGIF